RFDPVSEDRQLDQRYEELLEEEGDQFEAARRLIEEVSPRKENSHPILDTKNAIRAKIIV
ncbi:MAG: hypothetical protein MUC85_06820, partial [Anaerolineales bacterium]|nr:hypothetical protein [Anaerolineales bacterium]